MQRRRYALIKQPALDNLADTDIAGAASGDVMYFDGTNWINTPYNELVDDRVSSLLVAGNNIDLTYDDGTNSLTVAVEALTSADIGDFSEAVDDRLAALIVPGNNIDVTYNDALGTFTIDVEGLTSADISDFSEAVDDRVSSLLVAGNNIDLTYNDAGGTLTVDVEGLTSADVSDFSEAVDDRVSSLLVAGTNITLTYSDVGNTLTIDAAGGSGAVATDSIWDAKGDLAVGTGANTASRLAVGTDGYVLSADSAEATGLKWVAPGSGSGSVATDTIWDAKGDLAVGSGSNAASRLAIGADRTALVANSGATLGAAWASLGITPDTPPLTADTMDDEFEESSLNARWTWRNQSTSTATLTSGSLLLATPASATTNLRIIEQNTPTAPWKFRAKLRVYNASNTNYFASKMCVVNSSNGKVIEWGLTRDGGNKIDCIRRTNVTTYSAHIIAAFTFNVETNPNANRWMYFEIEGTSTTLTFRYSHDGLVWIQAGTETIASWITTVDRIGLLANSENSNATTLVCDWFRRIS